MLALSLRAVLRKESWMFCAGLLLSIADLSSIRKLRSFQRLPTAACRGQAKQTACSRKPSTAPGTRGDSPAAALRTPTTGAPAGRWKYDTAIWAAFQPRTYLASIAAYPGSTRTDSDAVL